MMLFAQFILSCRICLCGRTVRTTCLRRCCRHHHGNLFGRQNSSLELSVGLSTDVKWGIRQRHSPHPPWQVMPFGKLDKPKKKDFNEPSSSAVIVLDVQTITFLERLHDAETPPEVFAVLEEGGKDLTSVHYGRALGRLADIFFEQKQEATLVKTSFAPVLYDSRFKRVCHVVLQQSRHLENDLYLDTLESLQRLKIPLKSSMMYTFLAQAEQRINTFNAAGLAQFAGILSRFDSSNEKVKALLDAVAILTPRHINNLSTLHHTLLLVKVVGSSLDSVSRGKLAHMILAILAADEDHTLDDIIQAVLALYQMDYKLDMLLELACPFLTQNVANLSDTDLYNLICAFSGLNHADQGFFQAASKSILEDIEKWNVSWLINIAEALSNTRIPAPLLLDCIIRRVMDRGYESINLIDMTKLISSLETAGHSPPPSWFFDDFTTMAAGALVKDPSKLSSSDCKTLLMLTHSLARLGYFPFGLWEFVASRKFANWFMMVKDTKEYNKMVKVIQSLIELLEDSKQEGTTDWAASIQKLVPLR